MYQEVFGNVFLLLDFKNKLPGKCASVQLFMRMRLSNW